MKFKKVKPRPKISLLVSFNMYKGGSLSIYKQIEKLINQDQNIVNITFGDKYKFNLNSGIIIIYPLKVFNLVYRFLIEQVLVLIISLLKKPKKIIMLGNFPCFFSHYPQKVFFHNLIYIFCLKNPKKYSLKLFLESLFWKLSIEKVNPTICVQSSFIKKSLEKCFRKKLNIEIIGSPSVNFKTKDNFKYFSLNKKNIQILDKEFLHFIYPANFYSHKNHRLLFQCSRFFKQNKIKIHLTLEKKVIRHNNLDLSSFVFYNYLNYKEIDYLYKNCNALIYPSLIESLGLPLLEITNYNKTVIALNSSYVRAAIDNYYAFDSNKDSLCNSVLEFKRDFSLKKDKIAVAKIKKNTGQFYRVLLS